MARRVSGVLLMLAGFALGGLAMVTLLNQGWVGWLVVGAFALVIMYGAYLVEGKR